MKTRNSRELPLPVILILVSGLSASLFLLVALFRSQLYMTLDAPTYLLSHNIIEFFSVMVSLSIFGVGWYTFDQSRNHQALFLSAACLAIGLIDGMHILSFPGMPAFITPSSTNKGILFWISARLTSAVAFLASAYIYPESVKRGWSKPNLMTAVLAVTGLVFVGVFYLPGYLPAMFIEGSGLTPVKVSAEYLIIGLFSLAFAAYWRRFTRTGDRVLIWYLAAFIVCIFSELSFTLYQSAYDTYNLLGHLYKMVAFFMIYQGIFTSSVKYPYLRLVDTSEKLRDEMAERQRAEEALLRLNRELQAISNCNQTLLRAVDEQTLLNEICRIVCDEAGYRMAWVGYAEQDEAKTLRPVAWAGFDSGYIASAKLTWSDETERGRGPTGTVIRSGEIIYVQDFTTDPQMAPWRESALQRGYRSGIALPLKDENAKVFGVLMIYSSEANAITPDEIRLMEQLASDLVFGITALRTRADRKHAEEALRESEAKMRSILDNIGIGVALIGPKMEILELNQRMRKWFPAVDPAQHPICYRAFNDPPREGVCDYCPTYKTLRDGLVHEAMKQAAPSGILGNYRLLSFPLLNASGEVTAAIKISEDITEKLSLESRLQQAQKLESIGRLAGGVAHDFNNMLGVIIGHTELALNHVGPNQPLFADLQEIRRAAERSAELTQQLLAFARKQTIAPRVIDLNATVESMLKMLRRLMGEDIDLAWLPGAGMWAVKVDPSQIDQILANLCVNARDAIAGLGKVTIETGNAIFDEAYCAEHPEFVPGEYALLAVSDDGCGMDKATLNKLFEPFFTTKEMGKGTGLGLATVYGIATQNNGFINVYSEPGHGTTFKIYLPRHAAKTEQIRQEIPAPPSARGHETILLVEDEPAILDITRRMLEKFGYRVLAAPTPGEAIRVARKHAGEIHLLITDVVMPEMNGRDLAKKLLSLYPVIRHLFMSGYTANVIAHHGMLDEGVHYIQKPFSMQTLAAKVREVLDSK